MLSSCHCTCLTGADVRRELRNIFAGEDQNNMDIKMDIAFLKEQYDFIKDKRRRESCVVCFKKEIINQKIYNQNLMSQIEQMSLSDSETQFNFIKGSDSGLWRTHLDMHRITHTFNVTEHVDHMSDCSDVTDDTTSTEESSTDLSEGLTEDSDVCDRNQHLNNRMSITSSALTSRNTCSPDVLSRQLSFRSYRSCSSSTGSQYYPFPQMKCLKKSETARRLGLYASF